MAKKKTYYYVLVFTNGGPVYVTSLGKKHTCYWDKDQRPRILGRYEAEEISMGLRLNGVEAVAVMMPFELENQPYRYSDGSFEWIWKGDEIDVHLG